MTETITCECGARLRVPENATGQTFRCPRCKNALTVEPALAAAQGPAPVPAPPPPAEPAAAAVGASCPICQTAIGEGELALACPECHQVHHRECWAEVGGCGTYGCSKAPSLKKDETADAAPRSAWGDTKVCPACKETIKAIALRCRYCGTDFETVDPLDLDDLEAMADKEESRRQVRVTASVLFVLSLIGCLAPLMVIIDPIWVGLKRRELAKAGPLYVVLGYSSIIISVVYSLLILGFYLFSES